MTRKPRPIAIATCTAVAGSESDDLQIMAALRGNGIEAVHAVWDDPAIDWSAFSLVAIRSTWDYPLRLQQFLDWAAQLPKVLNPVPILKWNTDKRYLNNLKAAGLPVIATTFIEPSDAFQLPQGPLVVKPAVSCGAKDTARYPAEAQNDAADHVRTLQAAGRTVMVQPYLANIESSGETAVMFIGGQYSHSIRRDAVLKQIGPRSGSVPPSNVRRHEPTADELSLANQVMAAVPGGPQQLLYGRVDMIPGPDGKPLLMELELTEPSLFLDFGNDSVQRLADEIMRATVNS